MKIMVGIDLHSNNALCGLMDENGRRLVHQKLPCDLAAILQLLEPYKDRIATIAVESTFNWYWLVDGLQGHGYHVVLANPARMQPYSGMKYTDDVSDAYFLAELLRLNLLPTGHLYDRKTRPVRDLLRRRLLLVRQRTTLILSFKSLNERPLGQRVPLARVKAMKAEEGPGPLHRPRRPTPERPADYPDGPPPSFRLRRDRRPRLQRSQTVIGAMISSHRLPCVTRNAGLKTISIT